MKKCHECGVESVLHTGGEGGALLTYRCQNCGDESWVHLQFDFIKPLRFIEGQAYLRLVGRWVTKPSPRQVAEVKATFFILKDVGFSELWRRAIGHSEIELGYFNPVQISELWPTIEHSGIETTTTPIDSTS